MTEREATEIARRTAEQEGWAWVEPAEAILRKSWLGRNPRWEVSSRWLGGMVRLVIDDDTGRVLEKDYKHVPR